MTWAHRDAGPGSHAAHRAPPLSRGCAGEGLQRGMQHHITHTAAMTGVRVTIFTTGPPPPPTVPPPPRTTNTQAPKGKQKAETPHPPTTQRNQAPSPKTVRAHTAHTQRTHSAHTAHESPKVASTPTCGGPQCGPKSIPLPRRAPTVGPSPQHSGRQRRWPRAGPTHRRPPATTTTTTPQGAAWAHTASGRGRPCTSAVAGPSCVTALGGSAGGSAGARVPGVGTWARAAAAANGGWCVVCGVGREGASHEAARYAVAGHACARGEGGGGAAARGLGQAGA
jgi:hypothetical protein